MGLILRTTDVWDSNPGITVQGSYLTWEQGDSNWLYLLHNLSSSNGGDVYISAPNISISGNTTITGNLSVTGLFNATASWAFNALTSSNVRGGQQDYIPLWKTNTELSSSVIYQSSGRIGIGTTSPNYNLVVSGTVAFPNIDESNAASNVILLGANGQLFYTASSAFAGTIAGDFVSKNTFNTYTSSINSFTSSINVFTSSITSSVDKLITSASNALYTASVSSNVITFIKGNGTTFALTVNTGSGGISGDYVTTSSFNAYTSSINTFTGSTISGAAIVGGNDSSNVIRFTRKDNTTFDITVKTGSAAGTVGPGTQNYLAYFSGSTTTISSSIIYYDKANTRIGINTGTTPLHTLDVDGTGSFRKGIISTGSVFLKSLPAQNQTSILVYDSSTGQVTYTASSAAGTDTNIYNSNGTLSGNRTVTFGGSYLDFAGTTTTRFFGNGNIGINTTTDAGNRLDVFGSTRISGSLTVTSSVVYLRGLSNTPRPHLISYDSASGQLYYISTSSLYIPTLQQVTTAGSSSTDDIYVDGVFIKPSGISNWVAALDHTTAGGNSVGALKLRENSDGTGQVVTITAPTLTADSVLTIPDNTNRVFALSVNGNFANAVGDISLTVGSTVGVITTGSAGSNQAITGSLTISGSSTNAFNVSGAVKFPNLTVQSLNNIVVYDTSDGRLYYTASSAGASILTGAGSDGYIAYWSGSITNLSSSNVYYDRTNDRVGIGTSAPSSILHIRGTTANTNYLTVTSGSTPLLNIQSTPSGEFLKIGDFNLISSNTGSANIGTMKEIMAYGGYNVSSPSAGYEISGLYRDGSTGIGLWSRNRKMVTIRNVGANSGDINSFFIDEGYNPSSGTGNVATIYIQGSTVPVGANSINYTQLLINPGYTQATFGTGVLRGIYYNPVITSLNTSIHRAIETTTGSVIFNGGQVGIGVGTSVGNTLSASLHVSGTARIDDVLILPFQSPLPSSRPTASIALSGSGGTFEGMYVYDGTTWTKVGP